MGELLKRLWHMAPRELSSALPGAGAGGRDVDLAAAGAALLAGRRRAPDHLGPHHHPGPNKPRQNLGIYRQQVLSRNRPIMRWLPHRGGALDFRDHCIAHPGAPYPVAVALGADPATLLGAVTPVPDSLSEYQFAGLLRGSRTEVAPALGVPLRVPATPRSCWKAIRPTPRMRSGYEHALEGPYGDHTGYYNEQASFPVLTVDRITIGAIRSTTPPTPASRPTSRRCWAWR